jgi:hypothetical protein
MAKTDDTSTVLSSKSPLLVQLIEAERAKLLQAHAVMTCLREVLLYAEDEDAVIYAEAANAAACLVNDAVAQLDSVKLEPAIEALRPNRTYEPLPERGLTCGSDDGSSVKEPRLRYIA